MSVTSREFSDIKNSSILAFIFLVGFFSLVSFEFGVYISILAFASYLVFNLKWLHSVYSIFARETSLNSTTPKKVIFANFIPLICFYQPYYNIIELLEFAEQNTFLAYFNWILQLFSVVFGLVKAFGDQDFTFLYFTILVWLGFSFYLYQSVNEKINSLVK